MTTRAQREHQERADVAAFVTEFVKRMPPLSQSQLDILRKLAESDPPLPSQRIELAGNR